MSARLSPEQRAEILRSYLSGEKSSGKLAREYQVADSYPRVLAHRRFHRRGKVRVR